MIAEPAGPSSDRRRERGRLRAAVLRLGGLLGWQPDEVIGFAEALTGCPWRRCGCAEFEVVLDEYIGLVHAIHARAARRRLWKGGNGDAAGD